MQAAHLCLVYNSWYSSRRAKSEASLQYSLTNRWEHHYNSTVEEGKAREHRQKDEPEPQEDVYLLIQDIEGQDTESIVLLNCACEQFITTYFLLMYINKGPHSHDMWLSNVKPASWLTQQWVPVCLKR